MNLKTKTLTLTTIVNWMFCGEKNNITVQTAKIKKILLHDSEL